MNIQNQPKGSRERTLDEVKAEFMRRAGKLNPFEDIKREDAETVMAALKNLDKDHWAEEWSKIGLGYEAKGDAAAKAGASGKELAEIYMHAFDACRVGRYPSPTSPGKLQAYQHSLRMFRKAAKHFDPPLEIIEMPFEGKKLVGYLQKPPGVAKPPVVMHWGGVDGWKEDRLKIAKAIDGRRPRLAHHRHAGQRREPGAVRRSRPPSAPISRGSIICRPAPTSTASASRSGAAASAPTGRRGSPSPRRIASRARCSTAATCTTASSANGWCRPSPPAAPPICSARRACSTRAAARWA